MMAVPTLTQLRQQFKTSRDADRFRQSYGKDAFEIWLNTFLPRIVHEACNAIDAESRRFTLSELKQLVKLYVRSKPWGYTFLPVHARPAASAETIAAWVSGLDGYGHAAQQPTYRDRTPIEYGVLTPDYWQLFAQAAPEVHA